MAVAAVVAAAAMAAVAVVLALLEALAVGKGFGGAARSLASVASAAAADTLGAVMSGWREECQQPQRVSAVHSAVCAPTALVAAAAAAV